MKIDFFNPRSIILFICLLQGVVFAGLLFVRGRRRRSISDTWLAIILLVMCSGLITAFVGFASVYNFYQGLTYFPFEIVFALAPCIYLYVRSLTNAERRFQKGDLLHFVPTAIYLVYRFIIFSQDLDFKDWYDDHVQAPLVQPVQNVALFVWNAAYIFLSIRHYYNYRKWLDQHFSNTVNIQFDWLRNFLFLFSFLLVISAAFDLTDSFIVKLSYRQIFYYEVILACLTYYLAIAGYLRSETVLLNYEPGAANEEDRAEIENTDNPEPKKKRGAIAGSDLESLKLRLEEVMRSEKPFLEPELTLTDLSRMIGINPGTLSYVLNSGFGRNFNDFINEYRIEECKNRISAGTGNLSLLGVAFECGFNSKATFNRAFKKFTGVPPSNFNAPRTM